MKRLHLLLICGIFLFTTNLFAQQSFQSKDQTKQLSDRFMTAIVALDVQGGFKILKPYFRTASEEDFAKLQVQTINQLDAYAERFGFPVGSEMVKEETISDFLIRYTYIEKYAANILRWTFTFYKPKDQWIFQSLAWDENIQAVFD